MAKLSDIFGRRSIAANADKISPRNENGSGNGSNHIA